MKNSQGFGMKKYVYLCIYLGGSFQVFEALGFVNVNNSFCQNEIIRDSIVCFASIKKEIC